MPFAYTPVPIDTVAQNELQPGNTAVATSRMVDKEGPNRATNNNLYIPMGPQLFNGQFEVWRSTDNGATWAVPGAAQTCKNWAAHFQASTQQYTFAYLTNVAGNQAISLSRYDIATETLSAIVAAGAPSTSVIFSVRVRNNGDIVIFHYDITAGPPGQYRYSIWNGAAWTTVNFDATGTLQIQSCSTCIDSNDTIHFIVSTGAGVAYIVDYYNLDAANVLSVAQQFLWVTATNLDQRGVPKIEVSDALDTIFIANDNSAALEMRLFFGTPRNAPVFNSLVNGTSIGSIVATPDATPYYTVGNDGNMYIAYKYTDGAGNDKVNAFSSATAAGPWNDQLWLDFSLTNPALVTATPVQPKIFTASAPRLAFNGVFSPFGPGPLRFLLGLMIPPSGTNIVNVRALFPRKLPWPYNPGVSGKRVYKGVK